MNNIILVGFMGTGKSVVGRLLAKRLKRDFVDLDRMIERQAHQTIAQIFSVEGEAGFRRRESQAVEAVSKLSDHVIAAGGGVVLDEANVERLRRSGRMVCLTARPEVILKRTTALLRTRPLLSGYPPAPRVEELLRLREPFYAKAEFTVDTSDCSVSDVVEEIVKRVGHGNA